MPLRKVVLPVLAFNVPPLKLFVADAEALPLAICATFKVPPFKLTVPLLPALTPSESALMVVAGMLTTCNCTAIAIEPSASATVVQKLEAAGAKVYSSNACTMMDISGKRIENVYTDLGNLGKIFGVSAKAESIMQELQARQASVESSVAGLDKLKTAFYNGGEGPINILAGGVYGDIPGTHRHHIDFERRNNRPTNIERMPAEAHIRLHNDASYGDDFDPAAHGASIRDALARRGRSAPQQVDEALEGVERP